MSHSASSSGRHKIAVVLLHDPVTNRAGEAVTTAVTNMDIHDISRTCRTYEVDHYFLVNPLVEQEKIVQDILTYWKAPRARNWHPDRADALERTELCATFQDVKQKLRECYPELPFEVVMPDARPLPRQESCRETKMRWDKELNPGVKIVVFGTGGGVAPSFYPEVNTYLAPIYGPLGDQGYNHLSVRAAAAILLDRLFGK